MDDMKWCPRCGETKPLAEFYKVASKPDGVSAWCKKCRRLVDARSRAKYTYHLTDEQYDALGLAPNCWACEGELPPGWSGPSGRHIDHVDGTKIVRGAAHWNCNTGMGLFEHNPFTMLTVATKLAMFWKEHPELVPFEWPSEPDVQEIMGRLCQALLPPEAITES